MFCRGEAWAAFWSEDARLLLNLGFSEPDKFFRVLCGGEAWSVFLREAVKLLMNLGFSEPTEFEGNIDSKLTF
jgi:hypothetical protein